MSSMTLCRSYPMRWPSPENGERIQPDRSPQFGFTRVQPPGIETGARLRPNGAEAL